jgi:hypothetical protein
MIFKIFSSKKLAFFDTAILFDLCMYMFDHNIANILFAENDRNCDHNIGPQEIVHSGLQLRHAMPIPALPLHLANKIIV